MRRLVPLVVALCLVLTGAKSCGDEGQHAKGPGGGKHAAPGGVASPGQSWVPCHSWEVGVQTYIWSQLMTCRQLLDGSYAWVPW